MHAIYEIEYLSDMNETYFTYDFTFYICVNWYLKKYNTVSERAACVD